MAESPIPLERATQARGRKPATTHRPRNFEAQSERATKEARVTMDMEGGRGPSAVSDTEVLEGLNDLLQLYHDAIGAYEIAIEKLEDRDHADQIRGFQRDHERHIRELNALIQSMGGTPVNEPHMTGPFKQGMQSLGALGGDKGILLAWRTNELQVRTKYDGYASRANAWPAEAKRLIDRNALDEERHYEWVASVLERMGAGSGEGTAAGVANRVREQVASATDRAHELSGQARERVGAAVGSARESAASGLEAAAHRLDDLATQQEGAGGAKARAAGAAHRVAGGIESTAELLRSGDVEQVRTDLENRVRTSPVQTLLMTFAVGFVIGRILR